MTAPPDQSDRRSAVRGRRISLSVRGVASVDLESITGNVHMTGDRVDERLAAIVAVAEEMARKAIAGCRLRVTIDGYPFTITLELDEGASR